MGTDWEPDEFNRLILEADRPDSGKADFYFYDAPTVPALLVKRLAQAAKERRLPKLWVFHEFLRYQFRRMGLACFKVDEEQYIQTTPLVEAVVLAGSAGSLDKLIEVVHGLPRSDASVFVLQHVREDQTNLLDSLLQTATDWEVHMPQHLEKIRPSVIYVAPPGRNMRLSNQMIYLTQDAKLNYARPSIEALLDSAGREYKDRLIVALFCGEGADGVKALSGLRDAGAKVLIEDVKECESKELLLRAKASGQVDLVLPVSAMVCYLASVLSPQVVVPERELMHLFLKAIKSIYGYDFLGYREQTIYRRLERLTIEHGYKNFFELQAEVLKYPIRFESFFLEFSIKVTHFFRDPEQMSYILEELKPFLSSFPNIEVWCAGCASGEEAYSLAILFDQMDLLDRTHIFGTDINPYLLNIAEAGLYPPKELQEAEIHFQECGLTGALADYFEPKGGLMHIKEKLRNHVTFDRHSLAQDGVFNEFQLILCRNVLIYFGKDLRIKALNLFAASLHPDGMLLTGLNEGALGKTEPHFFDPVDRQAHVYHLSEENH